MLNRWMYRGICADFENKKQWVYGSLLIREEMGSEHCYIVNSQGNETNVFFSSVQQSTGYYDCEQKLIYEGDILKRANPAADDFCLVAWDEDEAGFFGYFGIKEIKKIPLGKLLPNSTEETDDYAIMGNIADGLDVKKCGWTDFEIISGRDCFWNASSCYPGEMVKLDGEWYLLDGWNGEHYEECFQYKDSKGYERKNHVVYTLTPVQIPDEFCEEDPMSWFTIGYNVKQN